MSNPLPAGHELVIRVQAKTISHTSVKPGKSNTGLDSGTQIFRFRVRDAPHRNNRKDQIKARQIRISNNARLIFLRDSESFFDQDILNDCSTLLRLMPLPSTPY